MIKRTVLFSKNKHRLSLRKSLITMLVAILLFFGFVFLISSLVIHRRAERDYRMQTSETAVHNVASHIDFTIANFNYISRLIMVNENVVNFLHADEADKNMSYEARMGMYEILNMYSSISYIESVYIFRPDGEFANTGKADYRIDPDSEEWTRILGYEGGRVISVNGNGLIEKKDKTPSLTFARAIYDIYTQRLIGVLLMNISDKCFDEVVSLQQASDICILDENGVFLSGNRELSEIYDSAFAREQITSLVKKPGGQKEIVTGMRSSESLVVLCCTRESSNVLPAETVFALLITLFAFIISVLVTVWFIGKNVATPIQELEEAMERTKSSGWLKRIDEELPNSEFINLAKCYNSMIDYLNELFAKLIAEEEAIRKAEMRVLHEQIKPHFLYNTLETISYIAIEEKAERAHDALETLGSFYRNFLSKGSREITFEKELNLTKDYLSLQKLRYGESFSDEYDISDDVLNCPVPKLILQPLVENCIYHGVRLKGELCVIRISAYKNSEGLHVVIYDSGVGMNSEQIQSVLNKSELPKGDMAVDAVSNTGMANQEGFGLKGTIGRIRYYCNNDDVVKIRSEVGEYTEIELIIPMKD